MTYEKYSEIRDSHGLKDAQVCKLTGIAPATISDWKHGKSTPKEPKLRLIAKAFGLSYPEFIGEDNNSVSSFELNEFEIRLIKEFRAADDSVKDMIVKLLAYAVSKED